MREGNDLLGKKLVLAMIVAVLSVSLVSTAVAAEDFGCACHPEVPENFTTSLHYTNEGMILE